MAKKRKESELEHVQKIINYQPDNYGSLGRRVEFGAKSKVSINKPGMKIEWFVPTVDVLVGVGKDHVANLIMDIEAWEALKKGQKINIETLQEFKKNLL